MLPISEQEFSKIFKELSKEKSTGVDIIIDIIDVIVVIIPPKLITLVANYWARPKNIVSRKCKGCFSYFVRSDLYGPFNDLSFVYPMIT